MGASERTNRYRLVRFHDHRGAGWNGARDGGVVSSFGDAIKEGGASPLHRPATRPIGQPIASERSKRADGQQSRSPHADRWSRPGSSPPLAIRARPDRRKCRLAGCAHGSAPRCVVDFGNISGVYPFFETCMAEYPRQSYSLFKYVDVNVTMSSSMRCRRNAR